MFEVGAACILCYIWKNITFVLGGAGEFLSTLECVRRLIALTTTTNSSSVIAPTVCITTLNQWSREDTMNQLSQETPNEIAEELVAYPFFAKHPLGVLATVTVEHQPLTHVVYCKVEKDFSAFFVTKEQTRKMMNIASDPRVSFTTFDEQEVKSGELIGSVEVIDDMAEVARRLPTIQDLMNAQQKKYWVPPIAQLKAGSYVLCKLVPEMMRFIDYRAYTAGKEAEPRILEMNLEEGRIVS